MASLIKNQLLKHLSIYTKNLSSDKINLSTFRGEGELSNLELDERVLTDLLELPSWLRLTSAWCNHVSFRISWTKLKSVPITLTLDEVKITVETCNSNDRKQQDPGGSGGSGITFPQGPQGKYSFIHKVVDGITIVVNTVNVKFLSAAFTACVQMSRIRVESKTPKWASGDLRFTRLKDVHKGIILIFKELSWQTVRIEASSSQDKSLTPLRLLTNQARCRITIRKRMGDCNVLSSRLVLILDDLLWVLTDSQLKAALHFMDSLSGLIKAATQDTQKTKAARKIDSLSEYQAQIAQEQHRLAESLHTSNVQSMFNVFDVRETSYHFFSQRIDLHLCDDEGDGRSSHPELDKGGALQVSVTAFQIDYYPYHLVKTGRAHWAKYKETAVVPALWLKDSLNGFREAVLNICQPNRSSLHHAPLERSVPVSPIMLNASSLNSQFVASKIFGDSGHNVNSRDPPISTSPDCGSDPVSSSGSIQSAQGGMQVATLEKLAKLMSACVILRIEDFTLYRVTTSGKKQMPKEFISGDKDRYSFPADMPILHAEYTYFYYPGNFIFPLPSSKVFVHMNPLQIHFDLSSILWLNSFGLNLRESLLKNTCNTKASLDSNVSDGSETPVPNDALVEKKLEFNDNPIYIDVKVEAIMPRIIIESAVDISNQKDRPKVMQIQVSRFNLSNIREMGSSRADLAQALHSLQEGSLVFGSDFPSEVGDMCVVTDRILSHVAASDVSDLMQSSTILPPTPLSVSPSTQHLSRYIMWSEPRDIWCIKLDPIWVDFLGVRSLGFNKPIPFIDAVPVTIWLHSGTHTTSTATFGGIGNSNMASQSRAEFNKEVFSYSLGTHMATQNNTNLQGFDKNVSNNPIRLKSNPFLSDEDMQINVQSTPEFIATDNNETRELIADIHMIMHVSNLISVQIDHFQMLFLLRLAEELNVLSTFLSLDAERILQQRNERKSVVFGCVVPQIEITFVMPSQTPGKESSGGDAESVIPDSASLGDDLHINSGNSTWPMPPMLDPVKNRPFGNAETPSPNEPQHETGLHISNPNTHGYNVQIQNTPNKVVSTPNQTSRPNISVCSQSSSKSIRSSSRNSTTDATSITKEINSGLLSMKKGFSSFMTSIDSAIKSGTPNDDISDTFSIQSDISSDSENFAIVMGEDKTMDCIDVMFRLNPFTTDANLKASPIEVASEVYEEPNYKTNVSSPSEPSEASTWRRRDLVSMATFRLTTVEFIRQNEGDHSSLRIQVAAIFCDECGCIPWDELQTKFGARCKAWNVAAYNPEAQPSVRIRLEEKLTVPSRIEGAIDKKAIQSWITHHADIRISDVSLDLSMSTVIGLSELVEDEMSLTPMPMNITLENVKLNLLEDRAPVNITSPEAIPINLAIGRMYIERDKNGLVKIQPIDERLSDIDVTLESVILGRSKTYRKRERDRELFSMQLILQQIKQENEQLRKQLVDAKTNTETYRQKTKQDSDIVRSYLKAAQDDISILLEEKKALLDTIRSLQLQLTSTSMKKGKDGDR